MEDLSEDDFFNDLDDNFEPVEAVEKENKEGNIRGSGKTVRSPLHEALGTSAFQLPQRISEEDFFGGDSSQDPLGILENRTVLDNAEKDVVAQPAITSEIDNKLKQIEHLDSQLAERNETLKQLAIACKLRKALLQCPSRRVNAINCGISVQWLSNGRHLLIIEICNNTNYELSGWSVSVEWKSDFSVVCAQNTGSQSQNIVVKLPKLITKERVKLDIFQTNGICSLPLLLRFYLTKSFTFTHPDSSELQSKTVILPFHKHLCTVWDFLQSKKFCFAVPSVISAPKEFCRKKNICKLSISKALVYLATKKESCYALLEWLLPRGCMQLESDPQSRTAKLEDLCISGHSGVTVNLETNAVDIPQEQFVLQIKVKTENIADSTSHQWISQLRTSLKLKLLMLLQDSTQCPIEVELNLSHLREQLQKISSLDREKLGDFLDDQVLSELPLA